MNYRSWAILLLLVAACNNEEKKPAEPEVLDSAQHAQLIASNDSALVTEVGVNGWLSQNLAVNNVNWNNLQLENFWHDDSLEKQPFTPTPQFYKDYHSVLHWSPDSTYLLDIGSYGSVVVKDPQGNTTLEGGDPDTEISVIFPEANQKARLLFAGPSSYIISAQWLDSTQALILGTFDQANNQDRDTLLWIIDVKDNFYRLYNFKGAR